MRWLNLPLLTLSLVFLALSSAVSFAQQPATVSTVQWTRQNLTAIGGTKPWIKGEVKLQVSGATQWVNDITVTLVVVYDRKGAEGEFDAYRAKCTIITAQNGQTIVLPFYIPWSVVQRDSLSNTPKYYFADVKVGGASVTPSTGARSSNLDDQALADLMSRLDEMAAKNDGIMLPPYLAPEGVPNPGFYRPEATLDRK